ncbi:uncharacterized protein BCR38DRAFT_414190 [Pseudomassariella vexata]|uniref:Uncharacterized protein n=1 Tax=Pseudomassariella vexata TaxID=1141098 RepID=A0A1Y2DDW2_9PEZI|nr:uncharacterized protein BCR38DRAFT_414190 [Pseudomassariella vexata]ORY56865.1 hypothetical protein BCR38DRAFT_414190 [Pseudomassariella vexata]
MSPPYQIPGIHFLPYQIANGAWKGRGAWSQTNVYQSTCRIQLATMMMEIKGWWVVQRKTRRKTQFVDAIIYKITALGSALRRPRHSPRPISGELLSFAINQISAATVVFRRRLFLRVQSGTFFPEPARQPASRCHLNDVRMHRNSVTIVKGVSGPYANTRG